MKGEQMPSVGCGVAEPTAGAPQGPMSHVMEPSAGGSWAGRGYRKAQSSQEGFGSCLELGEESCDVF